MIVLLLDPHHHDMYLKYNNFLPKMDNEVPSEHSARNFIFFYLIFDNEQPLYKFIFFLRIQEKFFKTE